METRILGRTNLKVTVIGVGGIPIQKVTQEETNKMFEEVCNQGINFIDTARGYGVSEEYIGNALIGIRDKFVIATKSTERTYEKMKDDIEVSLKNLKTDYIDLYQLHFIKDLDVYKQVMSKNGAYRALVEAKELGKIKHIGITAHKKEVIELALKEDLFETIQFPYNPIENQGEYLFEIAKRKNVGVIIMKPIAGGAFENGEISIKYILNNKNITSVIPGMENVDLVKRNAKVGKNDYALSEIEKKELKDTIDRLGETFCRRCGYCEPCEAGISIPTQFILEGYLLRYNLKKWATDRYNSLDKTAKDCTECGVCLTRCPYNLPIPEMMRKVAKSFINF